MQLYVYKLKLNQKYHDMANWDDKVQGILKDHADYLHTGVKMERVIFVGRTDTELKDNFGLAVFKADNLEQAKAFMSADPVIVNEIMSAEVYPFKLLMVTDEAKKWNVW